MILVLLQSHLNRIALSLLLFLTYEYDSRAAIRSSLAIECYSTLACWHLETQHAVGGIIVDESLVGRVRHTHTGIGSYIIHRCIAGNSEIEVVDGAGICEIAILQTWEVSEIPCLGSC